MCQSVYNKRIIYLLYQYMNIKYINFICILLICFLLYCFNQKEGFLTIDLTQFSTVTSMPDCDPALNPESCDFTYSDSGATDSRGHLCSLPSDYSAYTWDRGANESLYSEDMTLPNLACQADYELVSGAISEGVCRAHGQPFTLEGCIEKCPKPSELGGLTGASSLPPKVNNGTHDIPTTQCDGISMYPATNSCYGPNGIIAGIQSETGCHQNNTDNEWYVGGSQQPLKARCRNREDTSLGNPVQSYQIIGCEEGCLKRGGGGEGVQRYITFPGPTGSSESYGDNTYGSHREVIYIGDEQVGGPATDPYHVTETNLTPVGFSVIPACNDITMGNGDVVSFDTPFSPIPYSSPCQSTTDISNHESRRYTVSGCYPTCSDDERCINMKFTYSDANRPAPNHADFKTTLSSIYSSESTAENTISEADVARFESYIYYYRKYRGDGVDHIEAQFKCPGDDCEFIRGDIENLIGNPATVTPATVTTRQNTFGGGDAVDTGGVVSALTNTIQNIQMPGITLDTGPNQGTDPPGIALDIGADQDPGPGGITLDIGSPPGGG